MGKPKTQRTEALHKAARRYVIAEEVQDHIEQHNFDKLVAQGVIVEEEKSLQQLRLNRHCETIDNVIIEAAVKTGVSVRHESNNDNTSS